MKIYSDILHFGVKPELSFEENKLIRLTNLLNLACIFIIAIPAMITVGFLVSPQHGQSSLIRFELLMVGAIFNLYLNRKKYYLLAKTLTVFLPLFTIFLYPLLNHFMHDGMLLWMPYGIIAVGSFSFTVFSYKRERFILIVMILFFWGVSMVYDNVFVLLAGHQLDLSYIQQHYVIYKGAIIFICLLLYYNLYIFKRSNYEMQQELDKQNVLLQQLNELKSARIRETAYTNSHQLRASIARIIGLTYILKNSTEEEEKEFCIQKISDSVKEMDNITTDLSTKLVE